MLANLKLCKAKSIEDFENYMEYELDVFNRKFANCKDRILNFERKMQFQHQDHKLECEKCSEETTTTSDTEFEDLEDETEEANKRLEAEIDKNKELENTVADLNAMLDLYVREAQRREKLEEEWREVTTGKLKERIRGLEDEVFLKVGEIHNLENTVTELRHQLDRKEEELFRKNKEIVHISKLLEKCGKLRQKYGADGIKSIGFSSSKEE